MSYLEEPGHPLRRPDRSEQGLLGARTDSASHAGILGGRHGGQPDTPTVSGATEAPLAPFQLLQPS